MKVKLKLKIRCEKMYIKDMLKYRNVWLGIAMIWIVLFHANIGIGFWPLAFIKSIGYGGVDICLFASGIGCYFSLDKNSDILSFIKRRFLRIGPEYLIFIICWLVYKAISGSFSISMALGNLLGVQTLTGKDNSFNWYISAIVIFYFLAPYLKKTADKLTAIKHIIFIAFLLVLTIPFWSVNNWIIILTRIPIYYIGMVFAKACKSEYLINKRLIFTVSLFSFIGVAALWISMQYFGAHLWSKGLYWYPFIFITPGLCIVAAYVINLIKIKKIKNLLDIIGRYSFEIYLIHIPLIEIINIIINKFSLQNYSVFIWLAGIIPLVIGCIILKKATDACLKLVNRMKPNA